MKIEVNLSNSTIDFLLLPLSPSFALLLIHIRDFFLVNFSPFLWCARICHVYHEVNSSADQLVNLLLLLGWVHELLQRPVAFS